MLRTLRQDLRRAIISRRFLLAVMGAAALYVISAYDLGLGQAIRWGNKRHLLDYLGDAQTVALMDLLPFAAVIPFGAGFAEDFRIALAGVLRADCEVAFLAGFALTDLTAALAGFGLRLAARCFAFAMFHALDVVEMRPRVIA